MPSLTTVDLKAFVPSNDFELARAEHPASDQRVVMLSQLAFWMLAATDGHAKNFSIYHHRVAGDDRIGRSRRRENQGGREAAAKSVSGVRVGAPVQGMIEQAKSFLSHANA
jgi:hypothetical protein